MDVEIDMEKLDVPTLEKVKEYVDSVLPKGSNVVVMSSVKI